MIMNDDFDLPTPTSLIPTDSNRQDYDPLEHRDIPLVNGLQFESTNDTSLEVKSDLRIKEEDFNFLTLHDLEKKILIDDLQNCHMLTKNINRAFKFATSTNAILKLVNANLTVQKHRRDFINQVKDKKGATIEMDEYGNLKTS